MNESLIFGIIIGALVVAIFLFFTKRKSGIIDNTVLFEKEKEIGVLREEKKGLEKTEVDLRESLEIEREQVTKLLASVNKINDHKDAITKYTSATELKNKTDAENIGFLKNWAEKLTGSNRYQGDIGEKILKRVLNSCEYLEGRDFTCQEGDKIINTDDENELKRIRPDTYVKMTDDIDLVIDSKVSLDNWKNWVNEKKDEELKKSHLKKHLDSINKHIKELSGKRYARSLKKKVFPSTVMFIAFESGYLAALEHDPNIGEKAFNQNVILAGPGNIMAIIKIVETIKSKEKQIENVNEITRSASQLYDKYATLKSYLKKLVTSYNSHAKNLRSVIKTGWAGNANLEKQIINLKEKHGITAGKNIEKTLPEEDRIEDIDDPEDKGPYVN
jgi:DNA recombination protein RmuC|tara:strand:+ start:3240 stop:4403 length:1164 start_codon:yes stop_codon:yes gene_type:complete